MDLDFATCAVDAEDCCLVGVTACYGGCLTGCAYCFGFMVIMIMIVSFSVDGYVVAFWVDTKPMLMVRSGLQSSAGFQITHISSSWEWQSVYSAGGSPVGVASTKTSDPASLTQYSAVLPCGWQSVMAVVCAAAPAVVTAVIDAGTLAGKYVALALSTLSGPKQYSIAVPDVVSLWHPVYVV